MKSAVVVDYGAGNIGSITNFLRKFEFDVEVSNDSNRIIQAGLVVLPGVGSFEPAKLSLDLSGASEAIVERCRMGKPSLGICLGFQLMTLSSEESKFATGLGLIEATTRRLVGGPVIGWQEIEIEDYSSQFTDAYYFNHSYGVFGVPEMNSVSLTGHQSYIAYARRNKLIGTQFHPEKSQQAGFDFFHSILSEFWHELV